MINKNRVTFKTNTSFAKKCLFRNANLKYKKLKRVALNWTYNNKKYVR